ncbi:EndoU domain-containing protein [uncultured Vagococcus sp.]|uniref:EndoU domain-containing protein n=1 Tax=uncultured Vagococcus sp. TaxID=189676 RepID=UPI0028D45BD9|nr:EndoU domain-containing protein [uncultured Vagococcus sp.]
MSVDMYVSSSQSQASSVAAICRQQKQGYEQLQRAINDFVVGSPQLQGAAYDSAKQFFNAVLIPLSKGGILLSEAVMEACQKFPKDYMTTVDSGDLRESDLREKIEQLNRQMSELSDLHDRLQSMLFRQQQEGALDGSIASRMSGAHSLMATYGRAKQKLQEKLDKLLQFDSRSPDIFAEIEGLKQAVKTGTGIASSSWNSSVGTFSIPKSDKMSWTKDVNALWQERLVLKTEVRVTSHQTNSKVGVIYLYEVYVDGVYDDQKTQNYIAMRNKLLTSEYAEELTKGSHFIGEFVYVNDIYRLLYGEDWLSGDKTSRLEAAGWLGMSLLPIGKLAQITKEVRAGNKLLKGVQLSQKELKILHDAKYFGNSAKMATNSTKSIITPEIEEKILWGQRTNPNKNKIIGGHSPEISNSHPNYAVEEIVLNPDGTRKLKYTTQFPDGNLSKIKTSTVFPEGWSDIKIVESSKKIGNSTPVNVRARDGATWHRSIIDGVEIDVIKRGNEITSAYPTGTVNGPPPVGFSK